MKQTIKRILGILLGAAIICAVVVLFYRMRNAGPVDQTKQLPISPPPSEVQADNLLPVEVVSQPPEEPDAAEPPPPEQTTPPNSVSSGEVLKRARRLITEGQVIQARSLLSETLYSGQLSDTQSEQAIYDLAAIAEQTIFSPIVYEGDPYAMKYTILPGQTLSALERRCELHVPTQLLLKVNNMRDGSQLLAGQTIKLIQGPFHAVISKGSYTMDIYLQRGNLERVFIKRLKVGLGKDDGTPVGMWKVEPGKKIRGATWTAPPSSPVSGTFHPGDPQYPLGDAGYWISLIGTEPRTIGYQGYGLHGTNEPESIGKSSSLGCIRLGDEDIELVFSLLYEQWSTVEVRP